MEQENHILIVEDSRTQALHLAHILERGGYAVTTVVHGREALDLLAARPFTLVISDVMMPEMDGYELCRRIKEDPALAAIPVILLTFLSDTLDVVRGLEAGADNFVMKPFEPDFLLARIRRTLAARADRDGCPSPYPLEVDGTQFSIRSDRRHVLEILLSTYETVLQKNERLNAAREELRSANEELEAFSHSVSHDLRTPLSVIAGFGELLWLDCGESLGERGRDHLLMIRQAAERMSRLIEDLLKLSRATRAEIRKERFDLSEMVRTIAVELRNLEPSRPVDFRIQEGMTMTGDAALLRIAFENLLRNAWKFTAGKTPACIEVGWQPEAGPLYFVRDNGAGFDMKEAGKLFSTFGRLHSESEFPGTGLGLTIVQRIVARHNGRVWAEGRVSEGATFYLKMLS